MVYNALRFDSPFDFGARYQLGAVSVLTTRLFSLRYLWFNFRVYFLEPARWSSRFPFAHDIRVPPLPAGHWPTEHPFGVLTDIPLVWLALAVPLAWRGRADHRQGRVEWEFEASLCHPLGGFLAAIVTLFGISALTLGLFFYTAARYEMEFVPPLVLLAVIGILSLERTLSPIAEPRCGNRGESGQAHRLGCRRAARWGWSLLLVFSVAFNLLASFGQIAEAHNNLGIALAQQGKVIEAVEQYDQALRVSPDYAAAHNDLASALMRQGRLQGAIEHYEQAVRLEPDFAEAHYNLGNALLQAGRVQDAIDHYERAVRIAPDFVAANYNLGNAFARTGRMQAAIGPWEQALRIRPDFAEAHYSLGVALEQAGRVQDAIRHYEQALRIKPELVPARNALAKARAAR
jgi:tetratricopeptide (TPR) repeat protein